jgi:predicted alpha/beta hydrolase family esterase
MTIVIFKTLFLFEVIMDFNEKEFVFLHAYGDTSKDAFWPWLRKEIELKGGKVVFAPDLPNTENPNYEEQKDYVLKNYEFKENSFVIAHSLGNVLIMKILSDKNIKINGLLMVAPPLPNSEDTISGDAFLDKKPRPALATYCDWNFDFEKIKSSVEKIIVLADEKDHIVPIEQPKVIAKKTNAKFVTRVGSKTHFNGEKEEKVLEQIELV